MSNYIYHMADVTSVTSYNPVILVYSTQVHIYRYTNTYKHTQVIGMNNLAVSLANHSVISRESLVKFRKIYC